MKKTILATVTVAALVASAPFAKANAYLELISGASSQSVSIPGNFEVFSGNVGGWGVSLAYGNASGAPILNVTLESQAGGLAVNQGLTIIYNSGPFAQYGNWQFAETGNQDTVGATADLYTDLNTWGHVLGVYGTQLSHLSVPIGTASVTSSGTITQPPYYITEVLNVAGGSAASFAPISPTSFVTASFKVTTVPDGGLTLAMLGIGLVGMATIRSKMAKS